MIWKGADVIGSPDVGMEMAFDLRTIYAMTAAACIVLGLIQATAFLTGRFGRWLAWWGASNFVLGASSALIVLRGAAPDFVTVQIANLLAIAGYLLLPVTVRIFAGRSVHHGGCLALILFLSLPMLLVFEDAALANQRVAYGSALFALFDIAVAYEALRLWREERLYSAKLAAWLFSATAFLFAMRAVLAGTGAFGDQNLFDGNDHFHEWMGLSAMVFLALRSMVIVLMAAERSANKLQDAAQRDPLTGALNRAGLLHAFEDMASRPVALLLIDLDHFKQLNDTGGHALGDRILGLFAAAARDTVRPEDLVARHGGDEFVIILKDAPLGEAMITAERLRIAFGQSLAAIEGELPVQPTLSIGVAAARQEMTDLEALLHRADEALYQAKKLGRNTIQAHREASSEMPLLGAAWTQIEEIIVSNEEPVRKVGEVSSPVQTAGLF
jgi:diguanylate cyclase (GGDEF)-like protein